MSKNEKLLDKLKSKPKNFTYDEIKKMLNNLGFHENTKGKTSGSRVVFLNNNDSSQKIELHKPHPNNALKSYQIKKVLNLLEEWRLI